MARSVVFNVVTPLPFIRISSVSASSVFSLSSSMQVLSVFSFFSLAKISHPFVNYDQRYTVVCCKNKTIVSCYRKRIIEIKVEVYIIGSFEII